MLKKPLPRNDLMKRKYFLTILNLKSAAISINPKRLWLLGKGTSGREERTRGTASAMRVV
jgi:hypothetical protein